MRRGRLLSAPDAKKRERLFAVPCTPRPGATRQERACGALAGEPCRTASGNAVGWTDSHAARRHTSAARGDS